MTTTIETTTETAAFCHLIRMGGPTIRHDIEVRKTSTWGKHPMSHYLHVTGYALTALFTYPDGQTDTVECTQQGDFENPRYGFPYRVLWPNAIRPTLCVKEWRELDAIGE